MFTETGQLISHYVKARSIRWAGHVTQSTSSECLYSIINALVIGKKQCRRPKSRFINQINNDATELHTEH